MAVRAPRGFMPWLLVALCLHAGSSSFAHAMVPPGLLRKDINNKIRIVGGSQATASNVPFSTAGIVFFAAPDTLCTAVLISRRWALTAAHCIMANATLPTPAPSTLSAPWNSRIYYGCRDGQTSKLGADGKPELVAHETCSVATVKRAIVHPCFEVPECQCRHSKMVMHDDIALVELEADAKVSDADLLPIDGLNGTFPLDTAGGAQVTLVGYGITKTEAGEYQRATHLRTLETTLTTDAVCRAANPWNVEKKDIDFGHTLCAGGKAGSNACRGDSGGPMIAQRPTGSRGGAWVVGITSKASQLPLADRSCDAEGRLSMSVKTHGYGGWIQSVTRGGSGGCFQCPCYSPAEDYLFTLSPDGLAIPPNLVSAGARGGGASSPLTLWLGVLAAGVALAASHLTA